MTLIARFRLGSEMKEGRYWEGEKKEGVESVVGRKSHGNT